MGMLDLSQFDPRTFAPGGAPDWLQGAQAEAGPAPQGWLMGGAQTPGAEAALPPAAQPTAGQMAPPMGMVPAQGQPMARDPSLLDRLGAAFHGFAHSKGQGLLGALSNGIQGASTGERVDTQGLEQQSRAETFKALVAKGVPAQEALSATLNPTMMGAVAGKYLETRPLTNVEGQLRNPVTGELIANAPPKIESIDDPSTGMKIPVMRDASGRLQRVDPRTLPAVGPQPVQVRSFEEALRLPKGTPFTDPYGVPRVR